MRREGTVKASITPRTFKACLATALVAGAISFVWPAAVGICAGQQVQVSAVTRGYDALADSGRYVDGVVTNDTSVTVLVDRVSVGWAQSSQQHNDVPIGLTLLAPGQWAAFHADWPSGTPVTWTPAITSHAVQSDAAGPLELTVDGVSDALTDDDGIRYYDVSITNDTSFPVEGIQISGIERDTGSGQFVDAMDGGDAPDTLDPGESADFEVSGLAPWESDLQPYVRVTALEQPMLALDASGTTARSAGAPVTLHAELTHDDGSTVDGTRLVTLLASADGTHWCDRGTCRLNDGEADIVVYPGRSLRYEVEFAGDGELGSAESEIVSVAPRKVTSPSAPKRVRARRAFKVHGCMGSGAQSGANSVTVVVERHAGRKWVKARTAKVSTGSSGSYSTSLKLSSAGSYRIRAYRAGVGYTPYRSISVKK